MTEYSGFDMEKTIEWYKTLGRIPHTKPTRNSTFQTQIENPKFIELSRKELSDLLSLFPQNALDRSILRKIIGHQTTYFRKDSTAKKPKPTTNQEEALSPTAIIPSYADYSAWPKADIVLYKLPNSIPKATRKLIHSEGFIHEVGHTIVQPAIYFEGYNLQFPDGRIIDGLDAILEFAQLAEKHPPISHYASAYRGKDNKFESKDPSYNAQTAISEELCETIAAHFLGFAYSQDEKRRKNPFADRPEIKTFVTDFLNAKLTK